MQHVATTQHAGAPAVIQPAGTCLLWGTGLGLEGGVLPGWARVQGKAGNSTAVHLRLSQPPDKISYSRTYWKCPASCKMYMIFTYAAVYTASVSHKGIP